MYTAYQYKTLNIYGFWGVASRARKFYHIKVSKYILMVLRYIILVSCCIFHLDGLPHIVHVRQHSTIYGFMVEWILYRPAGKDDIKNSFIKKGKFGSIGFWDIPICTKKIDGNVHLNYVLGIKYNKTAIRSFNFIWTPCTELQILIKI